jgi:hypothetical protein
MRILLVNTWFHNKNLYALRRYKNIQVDEINAVQMLDCMDLSVYDCVYSPSAPVNVSLYPRVLFIFGPHFSTFPDSRIDTIKCRRSVYVHPSQWAVNVWAQSNACDGLQLAVLPFGIDTERFNEIKPVAERDKVFIYFKTRHPHELTLIECFLQTQSVDYKIFNYDRNTEKRITLIIYTILNMVFG